MVCTGIDNTQQIFAVAADNECVKYAYVRMQQSTMGVGCRYPINKRFRAERAGTTIDVCAATKCINIHNNSREIIYYYNGRGARLQLALTGWICRRCITKYCNKYKLEQSTCVGSCQQQRLKRRTMDKTPQMHIQQSTIETSQDALYNNQRRLL